ncbi:hypothetical protein N7522_008447 [Penicillium canescens]|uniref:Uncharacterized protein n=1 Tax=Penicillium canescens TaxID=5083 RepID=A0AAD6IEE7_PENCN|nr:uncharacterized protein N7446_002587 [Penicillium canescens]KAJ5996787.1 hypothetical protein N7522_008447 [Penicillium canescens]KAJ6044392.1 hypothetical protein N7460_005747 [Penicillium canescens]KAJ6055862.1 hypothetical protein N7444_004960 [Penicillium canescens]KAJ6074810.1 hypothetical protein N7446_002587 [Penicillium canescens]
MPFWFLPPDFTSRKDGAIRLGTVLEHPLRPMSILASQGNGLPADLDLPSKGSIIERNHEHPRGADVSVGMKLWAAFLEIASGTAETSVNLSRNRDFGKVDHEVWTFDRELSDKCLKEIMAVPKVQKYVDSGFLGRRPVYVITGVRITNTSFTVSTRSNENVSVQASTSASDPTGTVPITAGAEWSVQLTNIADDSYETAPGIVFAYRVHIIRTKGDGEVREDLFSHKKAFMTGLSGPDIECLEVNSQVLRQDPDEPFETYMHSAKSGDDWVSVPLPFSGN